MRDSRFLPLFYITILILQSIGFASVEDELTRRKIYFTYAQKTDTAPLLDGIINEACWQKGNQVTGFTLTAGEHGKTAKYQTQCFLLYDDTHLYVAFKCAEPNIAGIKTTSKLWDDGDIVYDDRVEIFIDVNHDHRSYYELAVNPNGVQFDQKGFNRLSGSKTCDMYPDWNCSWRAKTSVGENEWIAEIEIDITSLGLNKIEPGMTWGLNLARVRQPDVVKGDEFFKRKPAGDAEYSAWVPVSDYIRESISNFHSPIEFGDMVFGNPGFLVQELAFRSAKYEYGPVGYPSKFGWNPIEIKTTTENNQSIDTILRLTVKPASVDEWKASEDITLSSNVPAKADYYIPESQENKIVVQILDKQTKKQLYRTSYIEITAPFVEFDLYSLYTRNPKELTPVRYRLLADQKTCDRSVLELKFCDANTNEVIATEKKSGYVEEKFAPIFDVNALRKLAGGNYYIDCKLIDKDSNELLAKFKQNLTKYENERPKEFSVLEGDINYGGLTDHGIKIVYPFNAEFVFWRSGSYIPWWEVDQAVWTNEFVEAWGAGNQGCCEPMQDRECRYSNVELLEKSQARVVVHWRYALSDPHYRIYANEWVDEYYILYPDGVGVREVNLWPNSSTTHEMFEVLLAKPPCVSTDQMYDDMFASISTLDGKGKSNKYYYQNKDKYKDFLHSDNDFIIKVHFRDRMHPFTVFSFRDDLMPGVTRDRVTACSRIIGTADQRGHWPASRYQIDGYNTVGLDVPNHGNVGNIQAEIDPKNQPTTWTFLIGVADKGSEKPQQYAKSWLYPADVEVVSSQFETEGFDYSQRAYTLKAKSAAKKYTIKLKSKKGDIINPVFTLKNVSEPIKQVLINNQEVDAKFGTSHDGAQVIFINSTVKSGKEITFNL